MVPLVGCRTRDLRGPIGAVQAYIDAKESLVVSELTVAAPNVDADGFGVRSVRNVDREWIPAQAGQFI